MTIVPAFFPLQITAEWPLKSIQTAIAELAAELGFRSAGIERDVAESDAQKIIDGFIRDHRVVHSEAIKRLAQQRSVILERYNRTEYRWQNDVDEIVLVLANANVIPFPADDIAVTGKIKFACGWVDFAMPDRKVEALRIEGLASDLPLLFPSRIAE